MKKALAILLALSMVFAAFADAPATNYSVAEFSGSAEFGWKSDLDEAKNGMFNDASATLKINLLNGGDKSTEAADGVWGELKIAIETPDALENPGALTIGKSASVSTAKIHFVDGDVAVALDMLKPNLKIDGDDGAAYDVTNGLSAGFGINVKTAPVALNVYVMDNGVAAEKAFGFKADASLSIVDDLSLSGAAAYNAKDEKLTAKAAASYKIAIDENMAVTPSIGFKLGKDDSKALDASANFVWGGAETEVDFAGKGTGLTVKYSTAFADKDGKLEISAYDTLFEALKLGVKYGAGVADIAKGTLDAGAAYSTSFDIIDVSLHGGAKFNLAADDVVEEYKYGAKVSTDDVIANTVLAVSYEAGEYKNYKDDKFKDWTKDPKGVITVSAKISL